MNGNPGMLPRRYLFNQSPPNLLGGPCRVNFSIHARVEQWIAAKGQPKLQTTSLLSRFYYAPLRLRGLKFWIADYRGGTKLCKPECSWFNRLPRQKWRVPKQSIRVLER